MPKNYVIDTNVLLIAPDAIFQFGDNNVILPLTVIEEVDTFKKPRRPEDNELARSARQVSRHLKELMQRGRIDEGVKLDNGGTLKVVLTISQTMLRLPMDLAEDLADNRILSVAVDYKAIVVTNDTNMAIKAQALGLAAEEYKANSVKSEDFYTGSAKGYVDTETIDKMYLLKYLDKDFVQTSEEPLANQCFTIYNKDNPKQAALAQYDAVMKEYKLLPQDLSVLGLVPKNSEQQHALNLLLNPDIPLVTICGKAGSGKSLSAVAAGLYGVTEAKLYKKLLIFKPIVSMDNSHDLGYMPGDLKSKLDPWMASFYDAFSFLMGSPTYEEPPKVKKGKKKMEWEDKSVGVVSPAEELIALDLLELGSLENLRGRSLPNQFIIVDEVQNLSPHAVKTIVTRAGEGSKIVLLADTSQTDLPYLNELNNGFVYCVDRFKGSLLHGHIKLEKSVRSKLAEEAATLL